jgi:hypothetical protein
MEKERDGLACISSSVRSSCSTRCPQPTADDAGPEMPASVTMEMKRKDRLELFAMKSSDTWLVLPRPAARAQQYATHTTKLL